MPIKSRGPHIASLQMRLLEGISGSLSEDLELSIYAFITPPLTSKHRVSVREKPDKVEYSKYYLPLLFVPTEDSEMFDPEGWLLGGWYEDDDECVEELLCVGPREYDDPAPLGCSRIEVPEYSVFTSEYAIVLDIVFGDHLYYVVEKSETVLHHRYCFAAFWMELETLEFPGNILEIGHASQHLFVLLEEKCDLYMVSNEKSPHVQFVTRLPNISPASADNIFQDAILYNGVVTHVLFVPDDNVICVWRRNLGTFQKHAKELRAARFVPSTNGTVLAGIAGRSLHLMDTYGEALIHHTATLNKVDLGPIVSFVIAPNLDISLVICDCRSRRASATRTRLPPSFPEWLRRVKALGISITSFLLKKSVAKTNSSFLMSPSVKTPSTTDEALRLPSEMRKRNVERDEGGGGGDRTPTKEMNKLVHYDVLEPSECEPVQDISAHADEIQRKHAPDDFHWSHSPELHKIRRKKILQTHPEILKIQGPDPLAAVFCVGTVLVQFIMCYVVQEWSWPTLLIVTYVVSGTMNHSLVLAMHELSHDLFFKSKMLNKAFSIFCNLPTGVASAATFRRYHLEHHSSQGVDKIDVDIPTHAEAKLFRSVIGRFVWALFQPVFYGLRPMVIRPLPMVKYEAINWLVQLIFDIAVLKFLGLKSFFYLLWGSFFGLGLHPISGHFIAEHLEAVYGQETFSYYGPLNLLAYNVGYHNEHHDFPAVAGRNLPKVKALAPEWYDMPSYDSWTRVLYDFISKGNTNLYCRVKRTKA